VLDAILATRPAAGTLVPLGMDGVEPLLADAGGTRGGDPVSESERRLADALEELQRRYDALERRHQAELQAAEARGAAAAEERVTAAVEQLAALAASLEAQYEEIYRQADETVVRLATAIARRILGEAVQLDAEVVMTTVRRALLHTAAAQRVAVLVNPSDLQLVEQHAAEWRAVVPQARQLRLQADARVERGGCVVETESGQVSAELEEQLRTLEAALVERVR
jgi:flagellar assembly protein FliH